VGEKPGKGGLRRLQNRELGPSTGKPKDGKRIEVHRREGKPSKAGR